MLKTVRVADKQAVRENAAVQAAIKAVEEKIDGRVLVRESGTEPVIRVMTEAKELRDAERYVNDIIDVIKAEGLA